MAKKATHVNVGNSRVVPRPGYEAELKRIQKHDRCPFCESNLKDYHPKPVLFKTKSWIATQNAYPYEGAQHHYLLICRVHVERAEDLTSGMWSDLGKVYERLVAEKKLSGASLFMRSGDPNRTGASVNHLHAQIIVGARRTKESSPIHALVGFKK